MRDLAWSSDVRALAPNNKNYENYLKAISKSYADTYYC